MAVKNISTRMKICGRGAKCSGGHSAVEQSGYICREKMYSEYDGQTYYPKYAEDLVHNEVLLPENGPDEYKDPAKLWNSVEIGELCKLNRRDIDFEERECIVLGKGDKERVTYFDAKTKLHLAEYLRSRDDNNTALFVSIRKPATRLESGGIEAMLRKLGGRCNVANCHPHRFRRTCATSALSKGMLIEQVQKMLGHEEISTTLTYLTITDSTVKSSHRKYLG